MPDQRSCVDLRDDWNTVFFQVRTRQLVRAPITGDCGKLADYQPLDIRLQRFVVFDVGSVIADLRVSQNYDLAGIGRIGENLLVSGHSGIENDLARSLSGRTKTPAFEDASVLQGQDCSVQYDFLLGVGNPYFNVGQVLLPKFLVTTTESIPVAQMR